MSNIIFVISRIVIRLNRVYFNGRGVIIAIVKIIFDNKRKIIAFQ